MLLILLVHSQWALPKGGGGGGGGTRLLLVLLRPGGGYRQRTVASSLGGLDSAPIPREGGSLAHYSPPGQQGEWLWVTRSCEPSQASRDMGAVSHPGSRQGMK